MHYFSTRNKNINVSAAEAIAMGLSRDGGLFVPSEIPQITFSEIEALCKKTYIERAADIMGRFLSDFTKEELLNFAEKAYGGSKFSSGDKAPVKEIDDSTYVLELWHGPTSAFKDMALQMLPHLMTAALAKTGENKKVCILTATSGDTGKAALDGFADVENTKIMVFYPENGVSDIQKLQMTSQKGGNVSVCAVCGNFDDAQTGVKKIFSDAELRDRLAAGGWMLSSANSINLGRLLPQVVYYFSAYCELVSRGRIENGDKINFCVPTGNFGNILAGYYARKMGLPVNRLICASNKNDVLTEFLSTGVYNRNRKFYTTVSPSMDILISSNLERLLFHISGEDDALVAELMASLSSCGKYDVGGELLSEIKEVFSCGCCSDDETKAVISNVFAENGYLIDTHTAVAWKVLEEYREDSGDKTPSVVLSTASPYKFCGSVLEALGVFTDSVGTELIGMLEDTSKTAAPAPLKELVGKEPRFTECIQKTDMTDAVEKFLG